MRKKNRRIVFLLTSVVLLIGLVLLVGSIYFSYSDRKKQNHLDNRNNVKETPLVSPLETPKGTADPNAPAGDGEGKSPIIEPVVLSPIPEALPGKFQFKWEVFKENKPQNNFKRNEEILFGRPEDYSEIEGVTCFRGNNYRDSASYGFVDAQQEKLEKVWEVGIGYMDTWTGVGWNGQPAIVKWEDKVRNMMNLYPAKKSKDSLKEVICATLDGKIYFLDLDDGEATRPVINVGYPHKGSVSIDPRGYPLLYAGQGIPTRGGRTGPIGYRIYSLIDHQMLFFIDGMDPLAFRKWGAFDSTPLIDKNTDSLIECGENGIFYTMKLNTYFNMGQQSISIDPEVIKYRYTSPKRGTLGTENSVVTFRNLAYFADNSGTLQCVDLNTLSPVWIADITDDTDSTMALEETGNEVSLYTANEVDKQGAGGASFIRKFDALTGQLLWENPVPCVFNTVTNGGALGSPVLGKKDIGNLVIYNIAKAGSDQVSKLLALDKATGREVWSVTLDFYSWSSPVDVYTPDGKSYLIMCDSVGNMFLMEGKTGKILDSIPLGSNVEASPAVYDDMIVVGTRGQKIVGIRIK